MLKAIQILGTSSGFVSQRLKPHSNSGFSFTSLATKSSSSSSTRTIKTSPLLMPASSAQKGRFREFGVSLTRSESYPDGNLQPSSSSSTRPGTSPSEIQAYTLDHHMQT